MINFEIWKFQPFPEIDVGFYGIMESIREANRDEHTGGWFEVFF